MSRSTMRWPPAAGRGSRSAVVWLLAGAAAAAAPPALDVTTGFAGRSRAGAWTPLMVSGARPGDELRVGVQDPDGMFVWSPPERVDAAGGPVRFHVRFGRPAGRVRIERVSADDTVDVTVPAPLPSTTEVVLVAGDLPAVGRAVRLLPRRDGGRPAVIPLPTQADGVAVVAGGSAMDFDAVDTVVACGSSLGAVDSGVLEGIDAWIRAGGRLVLAAGTSASAIVTAGGPAAGWLPGPVAELVPLRRVAAIETHARASGLAERPAAAGLRVPVLANRRSLGGVVDVFEGGAATDLPLVVRRAHGLGTVTWIGLDLDAEPFRGWPGTDTLLARVLGGGGIEADAVRVGGATGPRDLAGQLRVALESPGPDGGIAVVPFAVIAGLGLLYVGCVFPLDWWLVSRSGRPWLAWLSLPALVAGFTATVAAAAGAWRAAPPAAADMRSAEVVDIDAASGAMRGRGWLAAWRRDNERLDVSIDASAAAQNDAAVTWFADSGPGFGAIDGAVAHPTLAATDSIYGASLAELGNVAVAARSTRLFAAEWSGVAGDVVAADLARDAQGTLRGSFAHRLPFPLVGCRLAHGGWVYDVGDLPPGERHDLATNRGPRSLAGALARREAMKEREAAARWDRGGTDLARILEVAGFHAAAGGFGYTGLDPGRLARLDLSPLLPLDRAVLVGTAAAPPDGWTTPWRVRDAAGRASAATCAARVYRIVIPLEAPPPRAAGMPVE